MLHPIFEEASNVVREEFPNINQVVFGRVDCDQHCEFHFLLFSNIEINHVKLQHTDSTFNLSYRYLLIMFFLFYCNLKNNTEKKKIIYQEDIFHLFHQ